MGFQSLSASTLLLLAAYSSHLWNLVESQLLTDAINTTTTLATTTLPDDPGSVMFVIIPVAILCGVPIVCSGVMCVRAIIHCIQRSKQGRQSRRVTPINGEPDYKDDSTKIHSVTISQEPELITYDQVNQRGDGGGGGLEAQPNYNYGWDF